LGLRLVYPLIEQSIPARADAPPALARCNRCAPRLPHACFLAGLFRCARRQFHCALRQSRFR